MGAITWAVRQVLSKGGTLGALRRGLGGTKRMTCNIAALPSREGRGEMLPDEGVFVGVWHRWGPGHTGFLVGLGVGSGAAAGNQCGPWT